MISSGTAHDPFLSVTPPPLITPASLGERRGVPLPTAPGTVTGFRNSEEDYKGLSMLRMPIVVNGGIGPM